MAQVRWTVKAAGDLFDIEAYIARDSALHAVNFIDRLIKATEKLQQAPQIGRTVLEFNRSNLREIQFRGYRIVYLFQSDAVTVLRVIHGARDLTGLVEREPWEIEL